MAQATPKVHADNAGGKLQRLEVVAAARGVHPDVLLDAIASGKVKTFCAWSKVAHVNRWALTAGRRVIPAIDLGREVRCYPARDAHAHPVPVRFAKVLALAPPSQWHDLAGASGEVRALAVDLFPPAGCDVFRWSRIVLAGEDFAIEWDEFRRIHWDALEAGNAHKTHEARGRAVWDASIPLALADIYIDPDELVATKPGQSLEAHADEHKAAWPTWGQRVAELCRELIAEDPTRFLRGGRWNARALGSKIASGECEVVFGEHGEELEAGTVSNFIKRSRAELEGTEPKGE